MKTRILTGIVTALVLGFVAHRGLDALADSPQTSEIELTAKIGAPAPELNLKDTFGKPFTLSEFKGKPIVLEWLNPDCPVSRAAHEKGKMQDIYRKYAEKGVIWLAVDSTHAATAEADRVHAARTRLAYPILMDADGKTGRAYQAKRTPHLFVIDKAGLLVYDGAIDDQKNKNYVAAALDDVLAGRPVSKPKTDPYGCGIKYAPAR